MSHKLVGFTGEVAVPLELTSRFTDYLKKFGKFIFHTYLVDEDDSSEISKYRIVISNAHNPIEGVFNNIFEADIKFEVLEKFISDEEITKKLSRHLYDLMTSAYTHSGVKYSIEMYLLDNSLQAKLYGVV